MTESSLSKCLFSLRARHTISIMIFLHILVTEEEIHHGLLSPDSGISRSNKIGDQALCFRREFNGVEKAISADPLAKKYFEKMDGQVDTEGMALLNDLKHNRVPQALPADRIYDYPKLEWSRQGVDPNIKEHRSYLNTFCKDVLRNLTEQIEIELSKKREWELSAETDSDVGYLIDELLFNSTLCVRACQVFTGRSDVINEIKEKVTSTCPGPLVIHGASGVGRTSVVAKVIQLLPSWFGDDVIRIFRFLRSTPSSTLLYDVLWSVLQQMKSCGLLQPLSDQEEEEISKSSTTLANFFGNCCLGIGMKTNAPLVIVLDTVDGLKTHDSAHFMSWLPTALADNIKIVISVVSGEDKCLCYHALREKFTDENAFVAIGPLEKQSALEIFKTFIHAKKRTLTSEQFGVVADTLRKAPHVNPLLISLLVKEAQQWRSYQSTSDKHLECVVEAAISHLFDATENRHGVILTSHALAYLAAAKQGLSDMEMEDVLSCDNNVLMEVYWIQKPPDDNILRIPGSLWQRIQYDLRAYMTTRLTDGRPLVWWAYRQFSEVASERYCPRNYSEKYKLNAVSVHTHLGDYFGDMFSHPDKIKPVTLTIRDEEIRYVSLDRQIPPQPLKYSDSNYNTRRLQEFPYHLVRGHRYDILHDEVLLMPYWLRIKTEAEGQHETLYDFHMYLEREEDPGVRAILHAMYNMSLTYPEEFEADLCARLLDYSKVYPDTVGRLVARAAYDCEKSENPCLLPITAYAGESGHLHRTIPREDVDMISVLDTRCELFLLTSDWDLTVFHIIQGDSLRQAKLGHLRADENLYIDSFFSQDKTQFYIVTQNDDTSATSVSCHVIDMINLNHVATYNKSIAGYKMQVDTAEAAGVSSTVILVRQTDGQNENTVALSLPNLDVMVKLETEVLSNFIGLESESAVVVFKEKTGMHSLKVKIYPLAVGDKTSTPVKLELKTNKDITGALLCTPHGLLNGEIMKYAEQLTVGAESTRVSLYDYNTGEEFQELELQFTPTNISATGTVMLVHFPWSTGVYDIQTFHLKFQITDCQMILRDCSSLGHLFIMDSGDMGKVYDIESGCLVEEWYPGCSTDDIDIVQFCKNPRTGSLYLLQSFCSLYQSLVKIWKPSKAIENRETLPPVTDKFAISQCGTLAVGLRKDFGLYSTDLDTGKHTRLATFHDVMALSISSDTKLIAVVRQIELEAQLMVYDMKIKSIIRSFSCHIGSRFIHMTGVNSKVKNTQCLGFANNNSIVVLRVPVTSCEAKIYLICTSQEKSETFKVLHFDGKNQSYQCKLYGDSLFYGFYGGPAENRGQEHGCFTRHDLKTGHKELYSVPSSLTMDENRLYTWRGSPTDYILMTGPKEYIDSEEDRALLADVKNLAEEADERDTSNGSDDDLQYESNTSQCTVIYSNNETLEIDLDGCLKKVFCHETAFVGLKVDGGLVHVDLTNHRSVVSYIDASVVGSLLLMSNVKGGDVTIFFNGSDGSLGIIDMRSGQFIYRYHLQGDTLAFNKPAHLHSTSSMSKVIFASDGATDVAVFLANDTLAKRLLSQPENRYQDTGIDDSNEHSRPSEKIILGAKLCVLM